MFSKQKKVEAAGTARHGAILEAETETRSAAVHHGPHVALREDAEARAEAGGGPREIAALALSVFV